MSEFHLGASLSPPQGFVHVGSQYPAQVSKWLMLGPEQPQLVAG